MPLQTSLQDLTIVVTGASGALGWATAEVLADQGARLVLHAGTRGDELRARVSEQPWADRAHVVTADLRDDAAVRAAFAEARDWAGRLDGCVANAGVWPAGDAPLHEMTEERLADVVQVNLLGAARTARAFLAALAKDGPRDDGRGASLVLIGSTAGHFGEAGHAAYGMSKSGLVGLMLSLKNEIGRLDPLGRVNLVEPGWVKTPMAREALDREGMVERATATMSVRRLAVPGDIARAVTFFLSPSLARHLSGQTLTVAGGMEGRTLWGDGDLDAAAILERTEADPEPGP